MSPNAAGNAQRRRNVIPNQVFVGCPWRPTRPRYEKAIEKLKTKYPVRFIIVGWNDSQDAEDLLGKIKRRMECSSYALFDATRGNANVSLEYGYAEARGIPRCLYLSTHKASRRPGGDSPIISDLASRTRQDYTFQRGLHNFLVSFCKSHAFTMRFDPVFPTYYRSASTKKRRHVALRLIHAFDEEKTTLLRPQIDHALRGTKYRGKAIPAGELEALITFIIKRMRKRGLLRGGREGFSLV